MKPTRLNLSEVCALFKKGDRTISKWIRGGSIRSTKTPLGFSISPTNLVFFLAQRKVRSDIATTVTPEMLVRGDLLTVPQASKMFGMDSAKPLYRAISMGELCAFDLSEDEKRGLRVLRSDVAIYLGVDCAKRVPKPKPADNGNGNGRDKKQEPLSLEGLSRLADQRIADAAELKRDVDILIEAQGARERISRSLAGDRMAKYYTDDAKIIESTEDFQEFLKSP